jgi:hypothetical protein
MIQSIVMTLDIRFSPETEAKLKQRAQETGKNVEQIIQEAVEAKLHDGKRIPESTLSKEQWLRTFQEWVSSHPVRPGIHLDDSRESIYAGRGE